MDISTRLVEVECQNCSYGAQWPVENEDSDIYVSLACCPYCTKDAEHMLRWIGLQSEQLKRFMSARDAGAKLGPIIHLSALEMKELADDIMRKYRSN